MNVILLDTGCIVALLDRSERHHQQCVGALAEVDAPLATCEAVIAESCYLLRGVKGAADAVLENVERGGFLIPYRAGERPAAQQVDFDQVCRRLHDRPPLRLVTRSPSRPRYLVRRAEHLDHRPHHPPLAVDDLQPRLVNFLREKGRPKDRLRDRNGR